jgi:primosomal protein N' (replication factor Y)
MGRWLGSSKRLADTDETEKMKPSAVYIEVAVGLPVQGTFTYLVPDELISRLSPGLRVLVPFGSRCVTGYVIGIAGDPSVPDIRSVMEILDDQKMIPESMLPFFVWISSYYHFPLGEVIRGALPGGINLYEFTSLTITEEGRQNLEKGRGSSMERTILYQLQKGPCRFKDLCTDIDKKGVPTVIRSLEDCGWIVKQRRLKGGRTKPKTRRLVSLQPGVSYGDNLTPARRRVLSILEKSSEVPAGEIRKHVPSASRIIKFLVEKGVVEIREKQVYRDPFGEPIGPDVAPALTADQERVVEAVARAGKGGYAVSLLEGVTGSGKTEVYLNLAERVLAEDNNVLVLVPEIALISQMERRFRARFGDRVALLHSGLSLGERYDQWMRIVRGQVSVAIGARSAVFAPFEKLGLIIVDEEHDTSYKQENGLRYNARDLAVVRGKMAQCSVLLGSATPSVESSFNARGGKYHMLELTKRFENRPLPEVITVDLREQRDSRGHRKFISPQLHHEIEQTLTRGEQVLLFLNRRGFSSVSVCRQCGETLRCRNCDIALTLHQGTNAYRCHYCGFSRPSSSDCPQCGTDRFLRIGLGTEKLESVINNLFPDAIVSRMDRDTTSRKGALVRILKELRDGSLDVLIGTQMVAKGHDYPNITLVGIICADLSLHFPDFRSGERTFQLLAQVAGRAGRGEAPGKVILQTYNPDHFSILAARSQDYGRFFKQEIAFRKALGYPPFSRFVRIGISGKERENVVRFARQLGKSGREMREGTRGLRRIEILGPIEAPLARVAGRFRWQILIKGASSGTLNSFVNALRAREISIFNRRDIRVVIDVDPVMLL